MADKKEIKKFVLSSLKDIHEELGKIEKEDLKFVAEELATSLFEEYFADLDDEDEEEEFDPIESENY